MPPVRITCLNVWGGRKHAELLAFVHAQAADTDVFCFQEVHDAAPDAPPTPQIKGSSRPPEPGACMNIMALLRLALPEHRGSFAPVPNEPERHSQAMFVAKAWPESETRTSVFRWDEEGRFPARVVQMAHLPSAGGRGLVVANYHGLWNDGPKDDTPARISQSQWLGYHVNRMAHEVGPNSECALVGDLNLNPATRSIAVLGETMVDLVKAHGITNTRTPLYRNFDVPGASLYADYAFVSKRLAVTKFAVLQHDASDHAALRLEVEIG